MKSTAIVAVQFPSRQAAKPLWLNSP